MWHSVPRQGAVPGDVDDAFVIEFAFHQECEEVCVYTLGLHERGLPELFMITDELAIQRMTDPEDGPWWAVLVGRSMFTLGHRLMMLKKPELIVPERLYDDGRSALFELLGPARPAGLIRALLPDKIDSCCQVRVTEWMP